VPAGAEFAEDNVPWFGRLRSASRAAPFIALILVGFLVIPLPPSGDRPGPLIAAAVLLAAVVIGAAMAPWQQLPGCVQLLPILGCLGVVGLLRDAEGGAVSAMTPLALVPVFLCALYGTRSQLAVVIAGVAAMFVVPRLVIGPPDYSVTECERAIIWAGNRVGSGADGARTGGGGIKLQSEQLKELAGTDALTGLANRRSWDESLGIVAGERR
jgi:hypothetical protein